MNLFRTSIVFFLSTIFTIMAFASSLSLTAQDFSSAKEIKRGKEVIVAATLSDQGAAKFQTLNKQEVGNEIDFHVGGETHHFKLRQAIKNNQLEIGPFSASSAAKAVSEINNQNNH